VAGGEAAVPQSDACCLHLYDHCSVDRIGLVPPVEGDRAMPSHLKGLPHIAQIYWSRLIFGHNRCAISQLNASRTATKQGPSVVLAC
jgi:hypothetical protein